MTTMRPPTSFIIHQEGVEAHVFKTRLDLRGNPIAAKTWHKLGDTFTDPEALRKHHEVGGRAL